MAKKISVNELQKHINTLSMSEILTILDTYSKTNGENIANVRNRLITDDLQVRLEANGINTSCPDCHSTNISKYGRNGNIRRFKCKDCGKTFTLFTGTILEKAKYHWDVWVEMVYWVLNDFTMEKIQENLEADFGLLGIDHKTVFHWVHKIVHALAEMPMPKLSGVVQIDETYFRESQKGSQHLVSLVNGEERVARYGRRPSKYGIMGNEFANVVVATNFQGYCVSKVAGLGKLTTDVFFDLFDQHLDNPDFICSDANRIYRDYCTAMGITLYVKPSKYMETIHDAGYVTPNWSKPAEAEITVANNAKILAKLYGEQRIDYIVGIGDLSYREFLSIKENKSLSLARVNQFHAELKHHIAAHKKGVSTKYLQDYVGLYTYMRNWSISEGHYPTSHKDAERIFVDILKGKTNYKTTDIKKACMPSHKASDKYMAILKAKTEEMRKLTKNKYFKYDEEDNVVSFDKRKYLYDLPDYKLRKLCSKYNIPQRWARDPKVSQLLREPNIWDDILLLIDEDKKNKICKEDLQNIADQEYAIEAQNKKNAKKAAP